MLYWFVLFIYAYNCQKCIDQLTCGSCMNNATKNGCIWCQDENLGVKNRCIDITMTKNCKSPINFDPYKSMFKTEVSEKYLEAPLFKSPDQTSNQEILFRKNSPISFYIEPKLNINIGNLDLYFLLDKSGSMDILMKSVKKNIESLVSSLSKYSNINVALGYFVDKPISPISSSIYDYCFRHVFKFDDDLQKFSNTIDDTVFGGGDDSEDMMDGLHQAVTCVEQVGWRTDDSIRKLILIFTDNAFHIPPEGKRGYLYAQFEDFCHLNENNYMDNCTYYDYVHPDLVYNQLRSKNINPIFFVPSDMLSTYNVLVEKWSEVSVIVTELDVTNVSILNSINGAILKSIEAIEKNSKVTIINNNPNLLISVTERCTNDPNCNFKYFINVESTEMAKIEQNLFKIIIRSINQEFVFNYSNLECICDSSNKLECVNGSDKCGVCECKQDYYGDQCECNQNIKENCFQLEIECSGKGNCQCNKCVCDDNYTGNNCECDANKCPLHNNLICAGNGKCNCNKCECNEYYMGINCATKNCSNNKWNNFCIKDDSPDIICSNKGNCECGKCNCFQKYVGDYCERTNQNLEPLCLTYKDCVNDYIKNIKNVNSLKPSCANYRYSLIDGSTINNVWDCSITLENKCSANFIVNLENNDITISISRNLQTNCKSNVPVYITLASVFGGVFLTGFIVILVIYICKIIYDRNQYLKFVNEKADFDENTKDNPLYQKVEENQNPLIY